MRPRCLLLQEEMKGTIDGELAIVISSTALACKQIASLVNRAGVSNLTGLAGAANVQVKSSPALLSHAHTCFRMWDQEGCPPCPEALATLHIDAPGQPHMSGRQARCCALSGPLTLARHVAVVACHCWAAGRGPEEAGCGVQHRVQELPGVLRPRRECARHARGFKMRGGGSGAALL